MVDVSLVYIDNRRMRIVADISILHEIRDYFSFLVENHRFNPLVQSGRWDGWIRLFHSHDHSLYTGLKERLENLCIDNDWSYDLSAVSFDTSFSDDNILDFINTTRVYSKGNEIFLKDHQKKAVLRCLSSTRATIESPTASGKSLVIYYNALWYSRNVEGKILIVVPNISLTNQLCSDFKDYANDNLEFEVYTIVGGSNKNSDKKVYISTWQSIYKMDPNYFSQFDVIMIDETHQAKADSLKGILEKSNAIYRYGFTGTLHDAKSNVMVVEGLLGPAYKVISTKELMDSGDVAQLKIKSLFLEYKEEECKTVCRLNWSDQCEFIETHKRRMDFICTLANSLKGNTLVLVGKIDNHLKPFIKRLEEINDVREKGKQIFELHGATKAVEREEMRSVIDSSTNCILVASYGVMSVGVNIKSIKNIIFLVSYKSKIRVLQSIGRGLRLFKDQDLVVYDIVDNLCYRGKANYSVNHYRVRHEFYTRENFDTETHIRRI